MSISFANRVLVPADVLVQELEGESVLLNLKTESYFGLDEVGSRIWEAVTTSSSIQAAYDELKDEYKVDPDQFRDDFDALLDKLLARGLLEVSP